MLLNYNNSPRNEEVTSATYVNLRINNEQCKAIMDSGAESTLCSFKLANKLNLKIMNDDSLVNYVTANGEKLNNMGWSIIDVKIGSYKFKQRCVVIKGLSAEVLFGTDALVNHGMVFDFGRKTLSVGKISVKLITKAMQSSCCLSMTKRVEIRPLQTHVEWMPVPEKFGESLLLQGELLTDVKISNGLYNSEDGRIPVIFVNQRRYPVVLEKGKFIGVVERVKVVNVVVNSHVEKKLEEINIKLAKDMVEIDKKLPQHQLKKAQDLITEYDHLFSKDKNDLGFYDKAKFKIDTGDESPIKSKAYRVPYAQQENIDNMVDEMLANKIITKTTSPWASPVVIVKKKDGTDRFCVDYRKLNKITIKDAYPVPLIGETLDALRGCSYFTTLDLTSGYHQMAMDEASKGKTAFITHKGLFQFEVLAFGLSNAVSAFQREMETILDGLSNSKVYLDDIMTHSKTFDEHLGHLRLVFQRLEKAGLKIKPSKCLFAARETKFLGFDISIEGIKPCEEKFEAIKKYPVPHNQKTVKRFLGLASYYRKFIRGYSSIVDPINRLLKKNTKFVWTDACQEAFNKVINLLINPPILVYPDYSKEFYLTVDASGTGLGGILSQINDTGEEKVIGYASRGLTDAEKNYSATELEACAVVWGINFFKHYLYGHKFIIWSDHNPLQYMDNMKNKTSKVNRWRLELSEYTYEIMYKKGVLNTNADALSRVNEVDKPVKEKTTVKKPIIKEPSVGILDLTKPIPTKNVINMATEVDSEFKEELVRAQENDDDLKRLLGSEVLLKAKGYKVVNDLIYKTGSRRIRLAVPKSLIERCLKMCHDDMGGGHLGFKKTWPKLRDRFYWKNMYSDTFRWLKSCTVCAKRKNPQVSKIGLNPINVAEHPFHMMGMDILGPLKETVNGCRYIIVFTDYLTRWPEAFAIKNREAKTIAKVFVDEIVTRHSAPRILLSDQAKEFMSKLVKEISNYLTINKINTTAYHAQCNGLTERFNATLCQILSSYVNDNQTNWNEFIPIALFAYRSSVNETTLKTPFELLYNREPRLPNDLESVKLVEPVVKDLKKRWLDAKNRIKKVNDSRKDKFDSKYKEKVIEIGDNVRMQMLATKTGLKFKMRNDIWDGPFKVIGKYKNGNLKIDIGKKGLRKVYITHPDRLKLAETEFILEPPKKENNKKQIKFNLDLNEVYFYEDIYAIEKQKWL